MPNLATYPIPWIDLHSTCHFRICIWLEEKYDIFVWSVFALLKERKKERIFAQSCDRSRGWRCELWIFPFVRLYICELVYLYLNMLRIVPLYAFELVSMCLCMFICLGLTVPDGCLSIRLFAKLLKLAKYVLLCWCTYMGLSKWPHLQHKPIGILRQV